MGGELKLALESGSMTYGPGDWCKLVAGTMHTERTDPSGATVLLTYK